VRRRRRPCQARRGRRPAPGSAVPGAHMPAAHAQPWFAVRSARIAAEQCASRGVSTNATGVTVGGQNGGYHAYLAPSRLPESLWGNVPVSSACGLPHRLGDHRTARRLDVACPRGYDMQAVTAALVDVPIGGRSGSVAPYDYRELPIAEVRAGLSSRTGGDPARVSRVPAAAPCG